ncbi:hypothetical protein AB0D59_46500 [Streptomyces sp. NPDC048417]|uniref:hypothetical protein n=1 Tax=Streptomyces sp. NPDC048417 TaxID=3155387 RepID=UPI0034335B18
MAEVPGRFGLFAPWPSTFTRRWPPNAGSGAGPADPRRGAVVRRQDVTVRRHNDTDGRRPPSAG